MNLTFECDIAEPRTFQRAVCFTLADDNRTSEPVFEENRSSGNRRAPHCLWLRRRKPTKIPTDVIGRTLHVGGNYIRCPLVPRQPETPTYGRSPPARLYPNRFIFTFTHIMRKSTAAHHSQCSFSCKKLFLYPT